MCSSEGVASSSCHCRGIVIPVFGPTKVKLNLKVATNIYRDVRMLQDPLDIFHILKIKCVSQNLLYPRWCNVANCTGRVGGYGILLPWQVELLFDVLLQTIPLLKELTP